jgi:hypothetical protein
MYWAKAKAVWTFILAFSAAAPFDHAGSPGASRMRS